MVQADGRDLPFADGAFDLGFSNAVVEHVGGREEQRRFVHELCRVAKRVFVTTPNRFFPLEVHSLVPFAHWLPRACARPRPARARLRRHPRTARPEGARIALSLQRPCTQHGDDADRGRAE